jgi:hypothetical protein
MGEAQIKHSYYSPLYCNLYENGVILGLYKLALVLLLYCVAIAPT